MVIGKNFVFIHLQKCAGTTIREFLFKAFPRCWRTKSEHNGIGAVPEKHRHKLIFGTVRNPWDWYVSWYEGRKAKWDRQFQDLFSKSFKAFLSKCLFTESRKLHDLHFKTIRKQGIGPYTYRYNKCYECKNFQPNLRIIKIENLRAGLINLLNLTPWQIQLFDSFQKLNRSSREHYSKYYNCRMKDWVREKDRKIIERHNYKWTT